MKSARCLLHLQCLRLWDQSARSAAQCAPLLQSASTSQPSVLHKHQHQLSRQFHSSPARHKTPPTPVVDHKTDKSLVAHDDLFERVAKDVKVKATFNKVVDVFLGRDVRRRGHVEFIYAALKKMPEFGVERDLSVYNKLLDVFPKEVFVPRNFIQRMLNHYPRQQECGVQVLEQMEEYGVMPNVETKVLLVQIFGKTAHPTRKYQRMLYWMPKFKHVDPFPVPQQLPEDPVDLARLSLTRVANDLDARVTVYQLPRTDVTETGEEVTRPHVVGIQSPGQTELLAKHDPSRPVFVEGPFPLWLRQTCVHYYVLRADPPVEKVEEPYDPERSLYYPLQLDVDFGRDLGDEENFDVEDLDEGPVFAMCMTAQGDQAALNQWISGLQENNPMLGRVPTLFRLSAGPRELLGPNDDAAESPGGEEEEPGIIAEEEPQRRRGRNQ